MKEARLKIARKDILEEFDKRQIPVLKRSQIERILGEKRSFWRLATSTSVDQFISFLITESALRRIEFSFPNRKEIRYLYGNPSTYQICLSLREKAYFSHYTAVYLHGLTEQVPNTIYVNAEQGPKPQNRLSLSQQTIDNAFKRPQRKTSMVASFANQKICLLNGMFTDQLGVVDGSGSSDEKLRLTSVERTLIDIAVRPSYSGGVYEVLKAFRRAKELDKVSINKLSATLKKLNFVYPYHQAIGFYLERSQVYEDLVLEILRTFEIRFDFYLSHEMRDTEYSRTWRLFYPKGL